MANTILDEKMRLTVVINGDEAQKELKELDSRNRDLAISTKELKGQKALLAAQGKQNTKEYKNINAEIKRNNTEVDANKIKIKALQNQIGITALSMRQLRSRASELRLSLHNMVPGSAEYNRLNAELGKINARIKELTLNSKIAEGSMSKLGAGFNKWMVIGASVIATGAGMVVSFQKLIDINGKLSDAQSDVQKTTGLSAKAVDDLSARFGLFKTRTARIELLKLAEEAGRLGKDSVEDVLGFVKVANQLKIALGDDLGEEQIREVGKMVSIYKVGAREGKNFEESMLALGSSINAVSASGSNQASYLVDFIKRTAGISDVANIAAQDMVGLAAAFDEAGQSQEISATAINKFFGAAAADVSKFAKVAGVSVKQYSKLLEEDANQALILFLKGIKEGNPTLEQMTERLKGIELGGTRGIQAITALASKIDNLESKQAIANKSLKEATSLTDEYNIKNNNLAASVEKIKKQFTDWFTSDSIANGLNTFITWFGQFIGAIEDGDGKVTVWRNRLIALLKALIVIGAALLSNVVYLKLVTLWTTTAAKSSWLYTAAMRANAIATEIAFAAQQLYAAGTMLLTGNVKGASQAIRILSATMKTTPWGLVLGLVTAVATAYYVFADNTNQATINQKNLNGVLKEAGAMYAKEKASIQSLLSIARDKNISDEKRIQAIKEINALSPEYLGNIRLENINTMETVQAIEAYIKALDRKALKQAMENKQTKLQEELINKNMNAVEDYRSSIEKFSSGVFDKIFGETTNSIKNREELEEYIKSLNLGEKAANATRDAYEGLLRLKEDDVAATQDQIDALNKYYAEKVKSGEIDMGINPAQPTVTTSTGTIGKVAAKKKEADELLALQRKTEDNRLALIQDAFKREMAINDANFRRQYEDLQKTYDENELLAAQAIKEGNTNLASKYAAINAELYKQMDQSDILHQAKRNEILEKGILAHLKTAEENFKLEEQARQTAHNNELLALGKNEKAKKALQDQFDIEKLERQKANELLLIAELQKVLDTSKFEGFSLDLLSDEQLKSIQDNLGKLGLSISEINALLAAMQGKDAETIDILGSTPGNIDVLGFSVDQWTQTFNNLDQTKAKMEAVVMTATAMLNAYSMFSEFQANSEKRRIQQMEKNTSLEKDKQARLLENKFISQKQHDDAVRNLDKELEKRKAEIAYKQAKRERTMAIANIAIQTGQAIMGIWAQVPKFDFGVSAGILTGIVSALGAVKMAMVARQPLPAKGFEQGYGMVRREQDGKLFNAAYGGPSRSGVVDKPTVFLAGEGGKNFPEMIIDGRTLKQFNPDLKNSLYRELGRIKGFENGHYNKDVYQVPAETQDNGYTSLAIALNRNSEILERLEQNGVIAYMSKDLANIKKMRDELERLQKLENKAKINT